MKIMYSYGKPVVLTEKGFKEGIKLYNDFKAKKKLDRIQMFKLYTIGVESGLISDEPDTYETSVEVYKELFNRYKPDMYYVQSFMIDKLLPEGYLKINDNFIKNVQEMLDVRIQDDKTLLEMYETGRMPNFGELDDTE